MSKLTCPLQIKQYLDKAEEYQAKRMYAEVIEQLSEAVQICPESAVAHNNLGAALANVGRYDEAEREFRQAIALAESDPYVPAPYFDAEQNLTRVGLARVEVPKFRISVLGVLGAAIAICFFSSLCAFKGDIRSAKIVATCGYLGAFALGRVLTNRPLSYFTVGAGIWTLAIFSLNVIFRRNIDGATDAIVFSATNLLGFIAAYHAGARPR
jgi:tetratricopeptide (TPR) repeat protein